MTLITTAPLSGSVRVLAVGDPHEIFRGRASEFRHQGLTLSHRGTALSALLELGRDPDAVVLVPTEVTDMPLLEFVDVLRSVAHVPVIAGATAGCSTQMISELFDHGVASTVKLPATPSRLAEAIRAIRAPRAAAEPRDEPLALTIGALSLDEARYRVTWHEREVTLAPRSFALLRFMMEAHPRVLSMRELMDEFEDERGDTGTRVRVAIGRLRAAFQRAAPRYDTPVETVYRVGYRLVP